MGSPQRQVPGCSTKPAPQSAEVRHASAEPLEAEQGFEQLVQAVDAQSECQETTLVSQQLSPHLETPPH